MLQVSLGITNIIMCMLKMNSFWDLLKSFIKLLVLLNLSLIKLLLNDGKVNLNELEAPK